MMEHAVVVGAGGRGASALLRWGSGWRGQLGMGPEVARALPASAADQGHLLAASSRVVCGPAHALSLPARRAEGLGGSGGAPLSASSPLVWGRNCCGQLGLGDTHDRHWPTPLSPPVAYGGAGEEGGGGGGGEWGEGVGLGSFHSVITYGGRVFASGRGRRGQTGLGVVRNVSRFTEIRELQGAQVSTVACGEDFTIAASKERAWGFGNGAKLGLGHAHRDDCLRPALIHGIPRPIRKIVSGWGHTLALAGDEVLAWGWNLHGQCGLGHKDFVAEACIIQTLTGLDIVDIAAGATHSLALTSRGAVLVWGSHADGKLGRGDPVAQGDLLAPHLLKEEAFDGLGVVSLAAGADHTAAITEDGGLWLWGFGQHGALGFAEGVNENRPRRLAGLPGPVEMVSCGMDITVVRLRA